MPCIWWWGSCSWALGKVESPLYFYYTQQRQCILPLNPLLEVSGGWVFIYFIWILLYGNWQSRMGALWGHYWRSRDKLIRDVLLWTPTYGRAKAGWPAWTYIQQLCEDTGCGPEDLPKAMNDREKWRERVRDICACGTTWWWWDPSTGHYSHVHSDPER